MMIHTVYMYVCVCAPDTPSARPCVTYKTKALQQALQAMGTSPSRLMTAQSDILASLCIAVRQRSATHRRVVR